MPNTWHCASTDYADCKFYLDVTGGGYAAVQNGDTVIIPAGTSTWPTTITLTKAINIIGASYTVDSYGVPTSCTTVILDGVSGGVVFNWLGVVNGTHRISGIEFADGGGGLAIGCVSFTGSNSGTTNWRIDHCRFNAMNGVQCAFETIIGVFDHNYVKFGGGQVPLRLYSGLWDEPPARGEGTVGDGSWAAASNLGSAQQLYLESNLLEAPAGSFAGMTDGWKGCRWTARYNRVVRGQWSVHGTESPGRNRGSKQIEIYRNSIQGKDTLDFQSVVDVRSGLSMIFENTTTNFALPSFNLTADRVFYPFAPWYTADGRNVWDKNVTVGSPFESGTASSGPSGQTLTDTTKTWTPDDKWLTYSVVKTSGTSQTQIGSIIGDSTSHGLTYAGIASFSGTAMTFTTGDGYAIYKIDQAMDAPGRSGGSLLFHQRMNSLVRGGTGNLTETITSPVSFASLGVSTGDSLMVYDAIGLVSNSCFGTFPVTVTETLPGGPFTCTYTVASDAGADYGSNTYFTKLPSGWNDQVTERCYEWDNQASDLGGTLIHYAPFPEGLPVIANEHYFNYVTLAAGYNGTTGCSKGTTAQMNAITPTLLRTAMWVTDKGSWNRSGDGLGSGQLWQWNGMTWEFYYEPYTYPHPLISGDSTTTSDILVGQVLL